MSRRDQRGVAAPSPLVMLSIIAVFMAAIAFVATKDQPETERRIETVATSDPSTTPVVEPEVTPPVKPKPRRIRRGQVYVEVFNNSGIKGLAARTATQVSDAGWQVVGTDNWYGSVPATTVYHPPRLRAEAKQMALDLGVERVQPASGAMKRDRLTLILAD